MELWRPLHWKGVRSIFGLARRDFDYYDQFRGLGREL